MNIKYYYGHSHSLCGADEWNPDADYGNEYTDVHFRIDTINFNSTNGNFDDEETRDKWLKEITNLIKSLEIVCDCGYMQKSVYLHVHPQDISGIILKNDVKKIAEAIDNMALSFIRWVDIYETVYCITDDEYNDYLDGKSNEIRKYLFTLCKTTRANKYYNAFDVARDIANKVRLHRLGINDGKNYGSGQTIDYILTVANAMIDEGLLKFFVRDEEKYIRSINKTEQRKQFGKLIDIA